MGKHCKATDAKIAFLFESRAKMSGFFVLYLPDTKMNVTPTTIGSSQGPKCAIELSCKNFIESMIKPME